MSIPDALELIAKTPGIRSDALAAALGATAGGIDAMLARHRADGRLVTCRVSAGGAELIEYRLSAAGNKPRVGPGRWKGDSLSHLFVKREETYGTSLAPINTAVVLKPAIAPAPTPKGKQMKFKERMQALFQEHGPMTVAGIRARGIKENGVSTRLGLAGFARLGGGKRSTVWGNEGQTLAEQKPAPIADEKADTERATRKPAKKRAGGGSVAMRRKRTVKGGSKAAKKAWRTRRANARKNAAAKGVKFRPALAADGAILFMGAKGGDFEIPVAQARGLVDLVRRLSGPELAVTVGFVERLDRSEVAA